MTNKSLKVADDLVVSLHYTLRLDDDQIVDSSDGGEPLEFLQGAGNIISGLEDALYGMAIGDTREVVVEAVDAYGEPDPDAYQLVSRDLFPPDLELEEGLGLRLIDQGTGRPIEAYVTEVRDDAVLLDLNHPLAGEQLFFTVQIVGLRPATQEELSHGHVHGPGHAH